MKRRNSSNVNHCMDSCFQSQSVQGHPGKETGAQECERAMVQLHNEHRAWKQLLAG